MLDNARVCSYLLLTARRVDPRRALQSSATYRLKENSCPFPADSSCPSPARPRSCRWPQRVVSAAVARAHPSAADGISFTTWGTDAELAGFRSVIASFQKTSAGFPVTLNAVPYAQMFSDLDAQIQANKAPDIFRVPYYTLGSYAGRGQLLDLAPHLPSGFASRFTPTAWAAVQSKGTPVGVPHHTDTSVILYNKDLLDSAGITSVPTTLETAWTWDQLTDVATTLRAKLPASKYPMVVNWQGNGVTRWLSWLFESNGRFLDTSLTAPAIDSDAARAAVDYTKAMFTKKFVPPNSSVKSTSLAQDIWFGQTAAMAFEGGFLLPDAQTTATFNWGATFAPRNNRAASDFGGNAVVGDGRHQATG